MLKMKTAKTFKKTPPIITAPPARDLDAESQFQLELYWCVQQLELAIANSKVIKQREDMMKNIKTLKSSTAPAVKKRQIMKASFGDYRSKMKEEEKKLALASRQIKFTPNNTSDASNKSSFVKKAAILTSGKDFKFNFSPEITSTADTLETEKKNETNQSSGTTATSTTINNLEFSSGGGFKFNFDIESTNEHIDFEKLSIKT